MNKRISILAAGAVLTVGAIGSALAITNNPQPVPATKAPVSQEAPKDEPTTNVPASDENTAGTVPSTPATSTPAKTQAAPPPVSVSSYKQIQVDPNTIDCQYTYSDGTTYQWHWQVLNPQGTWVTDGANPGGYWVTTTETHGVCDDSAIGIVKT